jgi:hypothetical protein
MAYILYGRVSLKHEHPKHCIQSDTQFAVVLTSRTKFLADTLAVGRGSYPCNTFPTSSEQITFLTPPHHITLCTVSLCFITHPTVT